MANYTIFCCRLRLAQVSSPDNGATWFIPIVCDAIMLDEDGVPYPPTGGATDTSVFEGMSSLEPLEIGDDQVDWHRKATASIRMLWTELTEDDTVTQVWMD